jgi:multisubunit Na+/H+ antiporter MnhF subunit
MHDVVFLIVIVWNTVLVAVLAVYALRAPTIVIRALALDTLALVFVAALAVVAVHRDRAGYLDIALMIAMLGFAQTVATARIIEQRRELE